MRDRPGALGQFLGALVAFLAPGAAVVGVAVLVSSPGGDRITGPEWVTACIASVVASAAVEAQVARKVRQEEEHIRRLIPPADPGTPPAVGPGAP